MIATIAALVFAQLQTPINLVQNPDFEIATDSRPVGYELTGSARWEYNGYQDEIGTYGVSLDAYKPEGAVSQLVRVDPAKGKWITFRFRAKAEDGFTVQADQLYMQIDFYKDKGTNYLDSARRLIYREILNDRKDFTANGDYGRAGAAVWRTYEFEELLPFAETDAVKVTAGFKGGNGNDKNYSRFLVDDFSVVQRSESLVGKHEPAGTTREAIQPDAKSLVHLGGRWYYLPEPGQMITGGNVVVTEANADRLFYKDDRFENPFAGNMTAWLRKGYLDRQGNRVTKDRLVNDNVVVTFDGSDTFAVTAHNIPNHTTARFPDTYGTQGYNPSYIMEQVHTYRLPLEPKLNPQASPMTPNNSNYGLNMGAIGFAVNGVVFYNPFDANMTDASSIMDRCCGHPSPDYRYHYHKYPICVNTPFVDKGETHSPLIGFAFDGFPVYGPYEAKSELAKDDTDNPLNSFNAHFDSVRGWHYHVTPGKFPYLIGGYMGFVNRSNLDRGPRGR